MFSTNIRSKFTLALLCTSSAFALSSVAQAQQTSNTETVVVTSSRVIADAANSPTPLTVVTTSQLQATTPTSLAQALTKLPAFIGSFSSRTSGNASGNFATDALNLRNFGAERTLVLFDGKRAVPSNADNTANVSTLPQMLMQRVDVVTGGASAVYGSDAVTGVVNFVLDKHFTGFKVDVNAGISNYSDGATENVGVAAGFDLFGGRGHIEGDVRSYHADNIFLDQRPLGAADIILTGLGTAANPYQTAANTRVPAATAGGKITCTGCAANGQQFVGNGIIGPFSPGTATGTSAINVGGDGARNINISMAPLQANEESFLRFSYNLTDDIAFYVQGGVNQSFTKATFLANYITTGTTPSQFFYTNPYLPAATQALLKPTTGSIFTNNIYFQNQGPWGNQITQSLENNDFVTAGLDGVFGNNYNWSVFFTHGEARLKVTDPHNQNEQRMWAGNDAVAGAGGAVGCYISTTTYASLYPGCTPLNVFGPTAMTNGQYNYIIQSTNVVQTNSMDDVGGSIAGEIYQGWGAGPIKAALSAEARWMGFSMISNANPAFVNCAGLRLCNTFTPLFQGTTVQTLPEVTENVWEFAGEVNIPLIKGVPLIQELNLDLAGRYTDYSVSGSAETWKIGVDYHVNDEVRVRATNSVDIRAPSLFDLYQPITVAHSSVTDIHTNSSPGISYQTSGNPNLVPEISRTYTAGVVFTPEFIPGLTASIDYYNISMTKVLTAIDGRSLSIFQICENSGGSSALCSLIQRPLPFSNTTTNNQPSLVLAQYLNAASQNTEGWDIELNYGFQLGDVWADAPGTVNLRMMANIQPVLESIPFPTSPVNFTGVREIYSPTALNAESKGHVTSFLTYDVGSWNFNLLDRWIAGYPKQLFYGAGQIYSNPRINSVNYQDITIDKKFDIDGQTLDGYLSIQNIGDIKPPLNLANTLTNPGIYYQGAVGFDKGIYDEVGRFFTLGVRARF